MGNSNDKSVLTEDDKAFINEHTSVTKQDMAMYENFLLKHPDGHIARKEFRLLIIGFAAIITEKRIFLLYSNI